MNIDDQSSKSIGSKDSDEQKEIMDISTPLLPKYSAASADSTSIVESWMEAMSKDVLTPAHFREYWRIWVPKIYSPTPKDDCLDWMFNEELAQKQLYNTLEEFICNGDPSVLIKQFSQMDTPPSVCGRAFKLGEPTYSCRECGLDCTCVLCVDCFKQSEHRHHKYKMGMSNGGGCCDCGDTEAWKNDPFCKIHEAGRQTHESTENTLPEDVQERARITFEAVLRYCFEILSLDHVPGLPPEFCVRETEEDPLCVLSMKDTYCTVMFNDETHTFDQVINTLIRVIGCSQRNAVEFVTSVDREGRAVVVCSGFQHCDEVRTEIERHTSRHSNRPLKVLVVHTHVIAHQIFAMKLLGWLQQFISHCKGFRMIFSDVALNKKLPDTSIVEGILMKDSHLWKAARMAWHKLFISGMLMEYESKKALAIVFATNYGSVMKDFIRDDHDHSYSIVCFSIQLFTVPTLAHHLIAHHDVLFILLNTFLSESRRRCNPRGKLEFERNIPNTTFKRAQFILYDLRYLLSSVPTKWTEALRRGFVQGMSLLLVLLTSMQSMDAVTRQVGQHVEYEPEWESAFNLHIKLSPVISLALEWCGSDMYVLVKVFRNTMKILFDETEKDGAGVVVKEVAGHEADCINYDVSAEKVSIHLPLSRFLAGLYLQHGKHDLLFQSKQFKIKNLCPEEIIEPVLRAQAMISQVHAGMWRRNGYSLINQLFFYHNVKCRTEMLDRDIVLLQLGAAFIPSDKFIIHILHKFNLLNWSSPDFETNAMKISEDDSTRQIIHLVEEFLGLLIIIIGERHVPNIGQVTSEERLKKEIIQQLCIKPLSHSELNKTLPDDANYETGMESVIDEVAEFKMPSNTSAGKGVYELKPHLYSEYNVFFYHYTKEELSKSEEAQRKRRKAAGELECCPPPKLPKLCEDLSQIVNLLQCDVMMHIMQLVLERALNLRARSFSEPQVHKVLHLIGYALQEQESGNYSQILDFTTKATKWKIFKLLEDLTTSPRIDAHKDLLTWVLCKYKEVVGSTASAETAAPAAPSSETPAQPASTAVSAPPSTTSENQKDFNTKIAAAQKRAKVMAQMAEMQKHFMKKNAKLFEACMSKKDEDADLDESTERGSSSMEWSDSSSDSPIALGNNQTARVCIEEKYTCILCQEDQTISGGPAMVLAAFIQQSTVLCQNRAKVEETNPLYLSANLGASLHTSTCGHVMHAACWQSYFDNVLAKENRRPYRLRQPASFDVEKHEYLCPLCECLSNTVLPLLPALGKLQPTSTKKVHLSFDSWVLGLQAVLNSMKKIEPRSATEEVHDPECRYCAHVQEEAKDGVSTEKMTIQCPIETIQKNLALGDDFQKLYSETGPSVNEDLVAMINLFAQSTYTKDLGVVPHEGDSRVPLLAWKSTAYTVHAIEFLLRDTNKSLLGAFSSRQKDSLEQLTRICAVLGTSWFEASTSANHLNNLDIGTHALSLLTMLLENPSDGDSILDFDPFGVLVPLVVSVSSLFNTKTDSPTRIVTGGLAESHALRLVFLSLVVKILLTTNVNDTENMDVDEQELEDKDKCRSLLKLTNALNIDVSEQSLPDLWRRVKDNCMPFLRCAALFFHFVTDVPAPVELTRLGGDTYENVCKYLNLPTTCSELVDCEIVEKLAITWATHPRVSEKENAVKEPLRVNKLVELPDDYSDLVINAVLTFTCPNRDRGDSRNPAMCLVCGTMLCSQSYCCQMELNKQNVGACTYHASKCGAGVGIFLRVRDCEILFLRSPNRGSFVCSPYLDEYGETDQGLRRGNPLRLCKDKYKQLNQLWLSHGIPEAIARAIDSNNLLSTPWQHL